MAAASLRVGSEVQRGEDEPTQDGDADRPRQNHSTDALTLQQLHEPLGLTLLADRIVSTWRRSHDDSSDKGRTCAQRKARHCPC